MDHESPGKQRDASHERGAPQSYCLLHPDGSLERDVRADAEDPALDPTAEILGIVRDVEAQHAESDIGAKRQTNVGWRAARAGDFVPAIVHRQIRLDAQSWRRHADTDRAAEAQSRLRRVSAGRSGVRGAHLQTDGDGNEAPTDHPERRLAAE